MCTTSLGQRSSHVCRPTSPNNIRAGVLHHSLFSGRGGLKHRPDLVVRAIVDMLRAADAVHARDHILGDIKVGHSFGCCSTCWWGVRMHGCYRLAVMQTTSMKMHQGFDRTIIQLPCQLDSS